MDHAIATAPSGRAKCRGCGRAIAKGDLRFGEHLPNPYSDDKPMVVWFHLPCGAYRRPEAFLPTLKGSSTPAAEAAALQAIAETTAQHRRLPRAGEVQRAPSGRARCRSCRETIDKETWRIALAYFQDGRFDPGGYIHLGCCGEYFETTDLFDRLVHFTPDLSEDDRDDLRRRLEALS